MGKIYNKDSPYLDTIRDLTESLNNREKELVAANRRFRVLFDHAPIGIIITANRFIISANKYIYTALGYNEKDLIGKSTKILYMNDSDYDMVGDLIKTHDEFTCIIQMRHISGIAKEYTLKVTKITTDENVASIYIEMRE